MKTNASKNQYETPHCLKCGGTNIDFIYREVGYGRKIDEESALRQACYYIGVLIRQEVVEGAGDASEIEMMGMAISDLATMLKVRQDGRQDAKEKPSKAEGEAQS